MPTKRGGMAGAVARNASGKSLFYTIGGGNSDNRAMRRVEAYDVTTNSWSRSANLPVDRAGAVATTLGGKIYVVGGGNLNGVRTKTLFVYDPIANTWRQKASMPITGSLLIPAAIDGKLYVFTPFGALTDPPRLYRYNPTTNLWTRRPDPPHDHAFGIGGVIDGKFYLAWGRSDAVDVYDPITNSWRTLRPETPEAECEPGCSVGGAASTVFQNQLYSIGGTTDDEYAGVIAYNPLTNVWVTKAGMNQGDRGSRAVAGTVRNAAGQQRIVVVGGLNFENEPILTTEMYTP